MSSSAVSVSRRGRPGIRSALPAAAAALAAATIAAGLVLTADTRAGLGTPLPPFLMSWAPRVGWPALLGSRAKQVLPVLSLAAVVLLGHGLWGVLAINDIHLRPKIGWQMLTVCWVSGLFWETFLFRLLGLRCHWARV